MDRSAGDNKPPRSPWALVCILFVIIIFGLFWMLKTTEIEQRTAVLQATVPHPSSFEMTRIETIEATASAISIPSFSEVF